MGLSMIWFSRVFDHAQQIFRQLMGQAPRGQAQDPPTWYCDSEPELGWRAYIFADTSTAGEPISSTKIRHDLQKDVCHGVIDGIEAIALNPTLPLNLLKRGFIRQAGGEESGP
jgi:hypothetical protein